MIRCGELCRGCGTNCVDKFSGELACQIECNCEGRGCDACDDTGYITLDECPRKFVGYEMTEAVNTAALCENGLMPISGGILDQSSWFVDCVGLLRSYQSRIESDQWERSHG